MISIFCFFFFNDPATTEIYTLSLHDALPISRRSGARRRAGAPARRRAAWRRAGGAGAQGEFTARAYRDRNSTRLNSSHSQISYAVFCLKKKIHEFKQLLNTYLTISEIKRNNV